MFVALQGAKVFHTQEYPSLQPGPLKRSYYQRKIRPSRHSFLLPKLSGYAMAVSQHKGDALLIVVSAEDGLSSSFTPTAWYSIRNNASSTFIGILFAGDFYLTNRFYYDNLLLTCMLQSQRLARGERGRSPLNIWSQTQAMTILDIRKLNSAAIQRLQMADNVSGWTSSA